MSVSSTPIGSVAISAVPMRLQMCLTSAGNAARIACSICVLFSMERSIGVSARRTTLSVMAPSESVGTNSEPRLGAMKPKATTRMTSATSNDRQTCAAWRIRSTGREWRGRSA